MRLVKGRGNDVHSFCIHGLPSAGSGRRRQEGERTAGVLQIRIRERMSHLALGDSAQRKTPGHGNTP